MKTILNFSSLPTDTHLQAKITKALLTPNKTQHHDTIWVRRNFYGIDIGDCDIAQFRDQH